MNTPPTLSPVYLSGAAPPLAFVAVVYCEQPAPSDVAMLCRFGVGSFWRLSITETLVASHKLPWLAHTVVHVSPVAPKNHVSDVSGGGEGEGGGGEGEGSALLAHEHQMAGQ